MEKNEGLEKRIETMERKIAELEEQLQDRQLLKKVAIQVKKYLSQEISSTFHDIYE